MTKEKETNDKKKVYAWWLTNNKNNVNAIATELGQIIITETGQNIIKES